jgi:putative transposase
MVPVKIKQMKCNNKNKICSIDPGLRTFLTCLSEDNIIEIGTNLIKTIKKDLNRKDKINGLNIKNKIKKRYEKIINEKIKNRINDMHWKTINYLTNKFGVIVIGKWSTKSIISNNNKSKMAAILKRISSHLSFYKFIQKLKYKCESKMTDLRHINESYTSKLCSECRFYNFKLKKSKVFKCQICDLHLDRDVNSAKNIMLKGIF